MKKFPTNTLNYILSYTSTGEFLDSGESYAEANKKLKDLEQLDKKQGVFVPDFYTIKKVLA